MSPDERPRPRPRPAPQTEEDPARPSGSTAPQPPAARGRPRRGAQALVQLNTRVLPLLDELVALVGDNHGISKREVIETALMKAYPAEYKWLVAREQARERES